MTKNQDNVARPRILLERDSYIYTEVTGDGPDQVEHYTYVNLAAYYYPQGKEGRTDLPLLEVTDDGHPKFERVLYEAGKDMDESDLSTQLKAHIHFEEFTEGEEGSDFADIANRQNEESRQAYYEDRAEQIHMERFYG